LQIGRSRQLRLHFFHLRHLPVDLNPRIQVAAKEITHLWLGVRLEQIDPQPGRADVIGFLHDEMPPRFKTGERP
jgi:hypothetical protein